MDGRVYSKGRVRAALFDYRWWCERVVRCIIILGGVEARDDFVGRVRAPVAILWAEDNAFHSWPKFKPVAAALQKPEVGKVLKACIAPLKAELKARPNAPLGLLYKGLGAPGGLKPPPIAPKPPTWAHSTPNGQKATHMARKHPKRPPSDPRATPPGLI